MNEIASFISTVKSKLDSLEIKNGQLIFVEDSREIYLDFHSKRTQYSDFIFLNTESQREGILAPLSGFYFVYETNILWRYDGAAGWVQITTQPAQQIVFLNREEFPEEGNSSCLYISNLDIYKWDSIEKKYKQIGTPYWETII